MTIILHLLFLATLIRMGQNNQTGWIISQAPNRQMESVMWPVSTDGSASNLLGNRIMKGDMELVEDLSTKVRNTPKGLLGIFNKLLGYLGHISGLPLSKPRNLSAPRVVKDSFVTENRVPAGVDLWEILKNKIVLPGDVNTGELVLTLPQIVKDAQTELQAVVDGGEVIQTDSPTAKFGAGEGLNQ